MTTPQADVTTVLVAAKDLIENVGWTQREMQKLDGDYKPLAFCLYGALEQASLVLRDKEDNLYRWNKLSEAEKLVREQVQPPFWKRFFLRAPEVSTISWNDREGRKKEEVIRVLDKAIEVSLKRQAA